MMVMMFNRDMSDDVRAGLFEDMDLIKQNGLYARLVRRQVRITSH